MEWFEDGRWVLSHDFWVAPGSFDLESSTAFIEPGTPLIAVVVFELELFVAPDERGASLRPDRGLKTREQRHISKKHTGVGRFRSFQCLSHQMLMRKRIKVIGRAVAT